MREFKGMVKALHRAGIEVILDVVYNHTAEGNHLGPMLCFKGVDNARYYRLSPEDPRYYMDFTGTGNSLNVVHPSVLRLIMDSLRYWVVECHVDGFRFDLASALARELYDVDRLSAFFDIIHQDPILSQVKLIAEPWDVGPGRLPGRQLPRPVVGVERHLPRHDARLLARRGERRPSSRARLTGSSDLYEHDGRRPFASINFITAHDGFTLHDLVSYNEKHNEANREDNRDGTDDNRSWNCGAEGADRRSRGQRAARAPAAQLPRHAVALPGRADAARRRRDRPHAGRQQQRLVPGQRDLLVRLGARRATRERLLEFTQRLIALRRAHPVFHRRDFLTGEDAAGSGLPDAWWFRPDGRRMTQQRLEQPARTCSALFLNGEGITAPGPGGRARRGRLVPAALQRVGRGRDVHAPRAAASARSGRSCFARADPDAAAPGATGRARGELRRRWRARSRLLRRVD